MLSSLRVAMLVWWRGLSMMTSCGADAGHHVVDSVAPLVEVALDLQRGETVGHDPDPPARAVGAGAEVAIGDDLGRGLVLLALAERADAGARPVPGASDLKSWGRLARSFAMITQRPTIGSFLSSGMASASSSTLTSRHSSSDLPHDPLEIGARGRRARRSPRGGHGRGWRRRLSSST